MKTFTLKSPIFCDDVSTIVVSASSSVAACGLIYQRFFEDIANYMSRNNKNVVDVNQYIYRNMDEVDEDIVLAIRIDTPFPKDEKPKWIMCSDRLPNDGEDVIVCKYYPTIDEYAVYTATFAENAWYDDGGAGLLEDQICYFAWMPYPAAIENAPPSLRQNGGEVVGNDDNFDDGDRIIPNYSLIEGE